MGKRTSNVQSLALPNLTEAALAEYAKYPQVMTRKLPLVLLTDSLFKYLVWREKLWTITPFVNERTVKASNFGHFLASSVTS